MSLYDRVGAIIQIRCSRGDENRTRRLTNHNPGSMVARHPVIIKQIKDPKLHAWLNTEKVPHEDVIPELLKAGDGVYSHEIIDIAIPVRPTKCVKVCEACG